MSRYIPAVCLLLLPAILTGQSAELLYARSSHQVISDVPEKGVMRDGEKVGVWKYYDEAGDLVLIIDYDEDGVLFRREDNTICYVRKHNRWKPAPLRYRPRFIGSPVEVDKTVMQHLHYPADALAARATGEVIVSAVIDQNGRAVQYNIEQDIGHGTGEAVLAALRKVPQQWMPARRDGIRISSKVFISVLFTMNQLPDFVSPENTPVHSTGMGEFNQHPSLNYFRSYTLNRSAGETELSRT